MCEAVDQARSPAAPAPSLRRLWHLTSHLFGASSGPLPRLLAPRLTPTTVAMHSRSPCLVRALQAARSLQPHIQQTEALVDGFRRRSLLPQVNVDGLHLPRRRSDRRTDDGRVLHLRSPRDRCDTHRAVAGRRARARSAGVCLHEVASKRPRARARIQDGPTDVWGASAGAGRGGEQPAPPVCWLCSF